VASPDRVLDGADLAAAEALARRAALALETAELVATLREAIAVRDERLTHLDTILGAIPIGLIICNPNLEVAEMNAVAAEMLGPDAWCGDRRGRLRGPLGEVIEAQVLRVLHSGEAVRGLEIEAPSRDEPRQYALALAPVWRGERIVQVGVVLVDRTTDHQIQQSLRYRLEFEQLLAALSTHFINLPSDRIDDAIEDTLRSVGEFLDVDATEIVLFSADGTLGAVAASWRADGRPVADRSFALADYPWSVGRLQALEPVVVSRVTEIDGEEERLRVMAQGIGSLLSLPLIARGGAIGFLRVATLGRETRWTSLDVAFVRLAAILVVNALDRKRAEASQRESERLTGIGLAAREMAHLIKNDLTGAIGVLELLLESPERLPRYQALMRGALRNLRRAADTVDQLQSVARVATKETAVGLALDLPRSVARD
jgi:GAF domain-containing protein